MSEKFTGGDERPSNTPWWILYLEKLNMFPPLIPKPANDNEEKK